MWIIQKMSETKSYFSLYNLVNLIFCFLPISLILGSLVLNLNILLLLFVCLRLVFINNLKLNLSKIEYFLIFFFLFYIFTTALNFELLGFEHFFKSLFSLRYLALYLLIKILLENNKIDLNLFFKCCLICTTFLSVDLIVQFFHGKNLLGMPQIQGRVAGFFGDEPIAGGYIQKLFLFSFLGGLSFFEKKNYKNLFIFFFLFIQCNAAIMANNRMSLVLLMLTIIVLIIFFSSLRKILILSFITICISFYSLSAYFDRISSPLKDFAESVVKLEKNQGLEKDDSKNYMGFKFLNSTHGHVYASVIHSYKSNVLFGNGYKSFKKNCNPYKSNIYSENKKVIDAAIADGTQIYRQFCSNHPHNYHLEVLHDTGIIGFMLMSIFVILKIIKKITKMINRNDLNYIYYFTFLNFLVEVFPLKSTGSLFSTWNGTLAWLIISLSLYELKKNKY
jgi:O-antigen ligase